MHVASFPISLADERLHARADAALHWPAAKAVFITDLHFGKAQTFRRLGIPVPERHTTADLDTLSTLVQETAPDRLVILGDFFHAKRGLTAPVLDALHQWRAAHAQLDILLIRGNHDRSAGDPPRTLDITLEDASFSMAPFELHHEPPPTLPPTTPQASSRSAYALAGHIHPAIRLKDPTTRSSMKLPCFHFGPRLGILPALGSFTGTKVIRPGRCDTVLALTPDRSITEITPTLTL